MITPLKGAFCFWVVRPCLRLSVWHAYHISGTMPVRILKFHIWIYHKKIADVFFVPFWSYVRLKKPYEILNVRFSKKCLSYGLETLPLIRNGE